MAEELGSEESTSTIVEFDRVTVNFGGVIPLNSVKFGNVRPEFSVSAPVKPGQNVDDVAKAGFHKSRDLFKGAEAFVREQDK